MHDIHNLVFREEVLPGDAVRVREITTSSGFFYDDEIEIAVELVEERLAKGDRSGYYFLFAVSGGETVGYCTFGPIACTRHSFDLYWIAVDNQWRGGKIGSLLMEKAEQRIASMGGKRIYVETSSRSQYEPTRSFYLKKGYILEAVIKDFYDKEDSKCILTKEI